MDDGRLKRSRRASSSAFLASSASMRAINVAVSSAAGAAASKSAKTAPPAMTEDSRSPDADYAHGTQLQTSFPPKAAVVRGFELRDVENGPAVPTARPLSVFEALAEQGLRK